MGKENITEENITEEKENVEAGTQDNNPEDATPDISEVVERFQSLVTKQQEQIKSLTGQIERLVKYTSGASTSEQKPEDETKEDEYIPLSKLDFSIK